MNKTVKDPTRLAPTARNSPASLSGDGDPVGEVWEQFEGGLDDLEVATRGASENLGASGDTGCVPGCGAVMAGIAAVMIMIAAVILLICSQFADNVSEDALFPLPALRSSANTEEPPPAEEPPTGAVLVPLAGPWSFADGDGTMECPTLSVPIFATPPVLGEMEVLDGGMRLLMTSAGRGDVLANLQPGATATSARYEGTIAPDDAMGGVGLVFTATFSSPTKATTHVGGTIDSAGTTCTIDRPGEATRTGG